MIPTLSFSFHLMVAAAPPPTTEFGVGDRRRTAGGEVSGGPTATSKLVELIDDTGRFTPSNAVIRILPRGVGTEDTFQSKLRALPSSTASGLNVEPPSDEKSTRWLCSSLLSEAVHRMRMRLPTISFSPPLGNPMATVGGGSIGVPPPPPPPPLPSLWPL